MSRYKNVSLFCLGMMVCFAVIFSYAYYANLSGKNHGDRDFYSKLGKAFLAGNTYIAEKPSHVLLGAKNPYAPSLRKYSLWDASYYNGRYYLYFGAVPALLPWIPVELLFDVDLGDRELCYILSIVGTLSLVWLLIGMGWRGQLPMSATVFGVLLIAFATWIPLMLRRPFFYEVAIAGAYCYMALGLCCLWYAFQQPRRYATRSKLLSGFFFGLSTGCRLFYAWAMVIPLMLWLFSLRKQSISQSFKDGLWLVAGWLFCMACIGWYNYLRFDSVFETGLRYQLSRRDWHLDVSMLWGSEQFWPNFYDYVLLFIPLDRIFSMNSAYGVVTGEQPFGVFSNSPLTFMIIPALLSLLLRKGSSELKALLIGLVIFAAGLTVFLSFLKTTSNRYLVDIAPWWTLAATLSYAHLLQHSSVKKRVMLMVYGAVTTLLAVYIGLVNAYCGNASC